MRVGKWTGDRFTLYSRAWILIFDIVAVSFLANALRLQDYFYTDGFGSFPDGLSLAPLSWSLLWTLVSVILNCSGIAYHPGLDVAMELVAWALVVGTIWLLLWSVATFGGYSPSNCSYYYDESKCTQTRGNLLFASEIIASVVIIVVGLLHFILFVKACIATQRRRVSDKNDRTRIIELEERVRELEERVRGTDN